MASDFMNKAIEYGIMSELTAYLLDNVLKQKRFWATERGIDVEMTINLALSDLQTGVFTEMLEEKLQEYHINPQTIIIDIPEALLLEDIDSVLEEFIMLKKIGVKLSIDHFGRESISLNHIERLPLDAIKIDGDIIKSMAHDVHKENIVSAILSMSKEFGFKVGANHVDSKEIRLLLEKMGCDFAQGYHFGKAVPAFEISDVIKKNT
jgi:EAL domain-containing protein (putative c-di-GMP-specific phosphodiesterase class I)